MRRELFKITQNKNNEITTFETSNSIKDIFLDLEKKLFDLSNLKKDNFGNNIKRKMIGIKISPLKNKLTREKLGPVKSIYFAFLETYNTIAITLSYIGKIITGSESADQLGGPIKIAQVSGQVAEHGLIPFLSIMAYISISLGLINLFPIPLLDGGHLMFYAIEKVLGRPLSQKTQEGFFRIGMFLLLSLSLIHI